MSDSIRSLADRFWEKVDKGDNDKCWTWRGCHTPRGYGYIYVHGSDQRMRSAHRVAWELQHGAIPEGLEVCHICDNPRCVNSAHLFLGTRSDNVQDMMAKGRGAWTPRVAKICAWCGSEFFVKLSHLDRRTYCSRRCMAEGYRQQSRGKENPNYRHGRYIQDA